MYLREIQVDAAESVDDEFGPDVKRGFSQQVLCVVIPFYIALDRRIRTLDNGKLAFVFENANSNERFVDQRLATLNTRWAFDFERYLASATMAKKRMILDAVHDATQWVVRKAGWAEEPVHEARDTLLARNFVTTYTSKAKWPNEAKKVKARVAVDLDLNWFDVWVVLQPLRGTKTLCRKKLGRGLPEYDLGSAYMINCRWNDEQTFRLRAGSFDTKIWTATFSDDEMAGLEVPKDSRNI